MWKMEERENTSASAAHIGNGGIKSEGIADDTRGTGADSTDVDSIALRFRLDL